MYVHCFLVVPITFGFVRSGHQHYVAVGVAPSWLLFCFCLLAFYLLKNRDPDLHSFHGLPRCGRISPASMGPAGKLINICQGEGSIEEYVGRFWEGARRPRDLPPGLLLGGASRASQSPNAILEPRGVAGGLFYLALLLSDSAFRVESVCGARSRFLPGGGVRPQSSRSSGARPHGSRSSQRSDACPHSSRSGGVRPHRRAHSVRSRAHSDPLTHRACSRARSVPGADRVRSKARSVPGADRVHSRARSVPGADRVHSRARSVPGADRVRSRARSVPRADRVRSRDRSVPGADRVRSRARSIPGADRVRSRARSGSRQSPL